ncbi:LA2681 family HEPN domain-containing protein [Gordonia polyisoprenivorans]|uniref:LA2681 family HEPN domain-containing protein n=1 Tax=Gordonia polyisoprenivorans TaxID=84595 RepID=UPI002301EEC8|nr:LA2681 family HEPN domain-containing protein [Gordonia polyisoprenivorans]WCB35842.1 LA2681 family HEPN domain-containing protein [Gordonia polyisoprenivorans]
MDKDVLTHVDGLTIFLSDKVDEDPEKAAGIITAIVSETFGEPPVLTSFTEAAVLTNAGSVLINAGSRTGNEENLATGELWMQTIVDSGLLNDAEKESAALYNLANSRLALTDIAYSRALGGEDREDQIRATAQQRIRDKDRLRLARVELARAAGLTSNLRAKGMRLCNLANALDHSGRWVEAYDAYVRALDGDPENGAAAGNAAVLIERAIGNGWDFDGHLCSLYDHYLGMAKANRAVTVSVAGEHAARKYDAMEMLGSDEPVFESRHEDIYRDWVARHRLALIAALEGTGNQSENGRWDAIGLASVTDISSSSGAVPRIFSILNVLKGDFLVARRLAFEAEQVLDETGGWHLHDSDTGTYADTLQYEVHGEAVSKLVLAHRAALDVLDKTAVAVNDHLDVGDDPTKVWFRKFWFQDKECTRFREALVERSGMSTAILAMAELALDMTKGGMYEHAQDVRNAGTHRFILVHHGMAEVESTATLQAITLAGMREACHQSLTVARAAFIYLVALLAMHESRKERQGEKGASLDLPDAL